MGGYSASKAALYSLSQVIRIELSNKGITVHTVNPGPVDTDLASEFPMEKASTKSTVANMLEALENNEEDIFPDAISKEMISVWKDDYRLLERMVSEMQNNS